MKSLVRSLLIVAVAATSVWAQSNSGDTFAADKKVAVKDDCDPNDPAWAPTGGCGLTPKEGNVPASEFGALLTSPLSVSTVGHPSWRVDPSYVTIEPGKTVHVTNEGGRGHTFTAVAVFGGGFIPPLNIGLVPAPECAAAPATVLAPGASVDVTGLAPRCTPLPVLHPPVDACGDQSATEELEQKAKWTSTAGCEGGAREPYQVGLRVREKTRPRQATYRAQRRLLGAETGCTIRT